MEENSDSVGDKEKKWRVLTVGDGDLSLSLALCRAYGDCMEVTASTIEKDERTLRQRYPSQEMKERLIELQTKYSCDIHYNVNATQLQFQKTFHFITFHHPHLGTSSQQEEEECMRMRHVQLLAHYFHSASSLLALSDKHCMVSVCLCGNQGYSWNIMESASRVGLKLTNIISDSKPWSTWFPYPIHHHETSTIKRKRTNDKHNKHYLTKYGYQHTKTNPSTCISHMTIQNSQHFLFTPTTKQNTTTTTTTNKYDCWICNTPFSTKDEYDQHYQQFIPPTIHDNDSTTTTTNLPKHINTISIKKDDNEIKLLAQIIESNMTKQKIADTEYYQITIPLECNGLRLKQFLRTFISQFTPSKQYYFSNWSKKQCEDAIQKQQLLLYNSQRISDSGRILRTHDVISIPVVIEPNNLQHDWHGISIIHQSNDIFIVQKPVGMRTLGLFSNQTCESIVLNSTQNNNKQQWECKSNMDTGITGLIVFQKPKSKDINHITYVYTAMVHGKLALQQQNMLNHSFYITLPLNGIRRWKQHPSQEVSSHDFKIQTEPPSSFDGDDTTEDNDAIIWIQVKILESVHLGDHTTYIDGATNETCLNYSIDLSTLQFIVPRTKPGIISTLSYLCRKQLPGLQGIVNDGHCKKEYSYLPRRIRHFLKNKLAIGCYQLSIHQKTPHQKQQQTFTIPMDPKLSSLYWKEQLDKQHFTNNLSSIDNTDDLDKNLI